MRSQILYGFLFLSTSTALATPKQVQGNLNVENYDKRDPSYNVAAQVKEVAVEQRDPSYKVAAQVNEVAAEQAKRDPSYNVAAQVKEVNVE